MIQFYLPLHKSIWSIILFHYMIFRISVIKDRQSRKSKGVAFILFLKPEEAQACVQETNLKEVIYLNCFFFNP